MPEIYTQERINFHKNHTGNFGDYNGRAKLTEQDVINIRTRAKNNEPLLQIYEDYKDKVKYKSIYNIVMGYC